MGGVAIFLKGTTSVENFEVNCFGAGHCMKFSLNLLCFRLFCTVLCQLSKAKNRKNRPRSVFRGI